MTDRKKIKSLNVDEENLIIDLEDGSEPIVANHDNCYACSVGAVCLVDGPVPDFEVAGLAGLIKITGWLFSNLLGKFSPYNHPPTFIHIKHNKAIGRENASTKLR